MPLGAPPRNYDARPNQELLPAGTRLWRVHSRRYPSTQFRPPPADTELSLASGGRFDATCEDPFPFLYGGFDDTTALAEVLLRSVSFERGGEVRQLTYERISGRRLVAVSTTRDIQLVRLLSTPDLAAAGQDDWVLHAEQDHYPWTRAWARWVREKASWADGMVWLSKRDLPQRSVLLFGDRCPDDVVAELPESARDLDDKAGVDWLNAVLKPYRVCVRMPNPGS
ncbi:RES family NAD+ phosphorylase [Flindersiella endophytica]